MLFSNPRTEWLWINTSFNHHRNPFQIHQDYVRTKNFLKSDGTKVPYAGFKTRLLLEFGGRNAIPPARAFQNLLGKSHEGAEAVWLV